MRKMYLLILILCTVFCLGACARIKGVINSPVSSLDVNRYLGQWYEIARFDHSFERGMDCTQAMYSLESKGKIRVVNTGMKGDRYKKSVGKAYQPDPVSTPGLLRVSFFGPFYSDYRILMLDENYSYSLVGSKSGKYLWILAREASLPQETISAILLEARLRGYDTSKLIWVSHSENNNM